MKVREVMIRDVTSLKPEDSAQAALELLFKMKISGLPVVGRDGKLAGMFTEKGILRHILPSYVEKVGKFIYEENPKSTRKKFAALSSMKVSDIMRTEVVTTTEDVTLCEAARLMLTQRVRRVPVVDKSGKVIGMVARCDILKAMTKEARGADQ